MTCIEIIFFLLLYKDKRMSSSNILLHRENEQRLTLFAGTQCTCNMKSSKGNQTHSTSIFMSCLHLHDLNTTLSASCTLFQTNRQHTKTVCVMVNCSPRPTCPNLDSADLYQAALVNMPWGMKLPNICDCFVWLCDCLCVCLKGVQPCGTSLHCMHNSIVRLMETGSYSLQWSMIDGQWQTSADRQRQHWTFKDQVGHQNNWMCEVEDRRSSTFLLYKKSYYKHYSSLTAETLALV